MQTIMETTRGLSILVRVGGDRLLGLAAVGAALTAGAWLCALYLV
jgi:hypothetical protein